MSDYSLGAQNAKSIFDGFADGDVIIGSVALTTAQLASGVAHGLSGTPDWVLIGTSQAAASMLEGIAWTADGTTLTLSKVDTQAEAVISYLAGNLS